MLYRGHPTAEYNILPLSFHSFSQLGGCAVFVSGSHVGGEKYALNNYIGNSLVQVRGNLPSPRGYQLVGHKKQRMMTCSRRYINILSVHTCG